MNAADTLNILIIDDDTGDRKNISRSLKRSGLHCEIFEAEGIPTALQALSQVAFDCIFIDYNMPLFNGLEGIAHLKKFAPHVPIVMVTGQGDELLAKRAIKRGAADYLPKRLVSSDTVETAVNHVLEVAALECKLQEQRAALATFSRMLSHDLKAPVRHIRIVGETMGRAIEAADLARAGELYPALQKMVGRISALVNTLDEYNKSLTPNVAFDAVDLKPVVDGAIENLQLEIEAAGASITCDELPVVVGNEAMLIQLFQNLIGNAVKFSRQGTPNVHIGATEGEGVYEVFVRDNGIGIEQKFLDAIFQPFKRLNPIGEFDGTGLGLATCYKVIERHGGKIWCESTPGEGSTFHFTLGRPAD